MGKPNDPLYLKFDDWCIDLFKFLENLCPGEYDAFINVDKLSKAYHDGNTPEGYAMFIALKISKSKEPGKILAPFTDEQVKKLEEVIKQARLKGFEMDHAISPVMFESWMNAELAFCNTACAILSMWLREKGLYIAIAPFGGEFSFFVDGPANTTGKKPHSFGGIKSWEEAWLAGIEEALKLLPNE